MPKIDDETLRKRYEQAKSDWDERQKENRARQRREKAQADARRRTLIGEMVLRRVEQNPHEHERLMTGLDSFLEDARDRVLFDLSPRSEAPASTPSTEPLPPGGSSPQSLASGLSCASISVTITPSIAPAVSGSYFARHSRGISSCYMELCSNERAV